LQRKKQHEPRSSTLRGTTIDLSKEEKNAWNSIRFSIELDLHEIDVSDLQFEKQDEPRTLTVRGTTIDSRQQPKNAFDRISLSENAGPVHTIPQRKSIRTLSVNLAIKARKPNRSYSASLVRTVRPFDFGSRTSVFSEKPSIADLPSIGFY
jgi:hypothetical protein